MTNVPSNFNSGDLVTWATIDRVRKVKIDIDLHNEAGEKIDISQSVQDLTKYVQDKLAASQNGVNLVQQQVFPLIARLAATTLKSVVGEHSASLMLTQESLRNALITCAMVAFFFRQFMHQQNITIHTQEIPISNEEIEKYNRINSLISQVSTAIYLGADLEEFIAEMLKNGFLKYDDLQSLGLEPEKFQQIFKNKTKN